MSIKENILILFNNISEKFKKNSKKKYYYIIAGILFIIIGINIFISIITNTKSEVINKSISAIENSNVSKLDNIARLSNGEKINSNNLAPIIRFFATDKARIQTLKKALLSNGEAYGITIAKQKNMLATDYFLVIPTANVTIDTNDQNSDLYIDGKKEGELSSGQSVSLLVPGVYNLRLENKNEYATLATSTDVIVTENKNIKMPINGINIKITSNADDATVYINGQSTNKTVSELNTIGPFPTDGSYNINLKYQTPFGDVASPIVPIENLPDIKLDLNFKTSQMKSSLNNAIGKFYDSVFTAIDTKDNSKVVDATSEAKNKIYDNIKENSFILKNIYKLNSSSIDFDKSTIELINGVYYVNAVANIDYNIKKEILGLPLKSTNYEQTFFTKLEYKNNKWQIYDIENFSLKTIE